MSSDDEGTGSGGMVPSSGSVDVQRRDQRALRARRASQRRSATSALAAMRDGSSETTPLPSDKAEDDTKRVASLRERARQRKSGGRRGADEDDSVDLEDRSTSYEPTSDDDSRDARRGTRMRAAQAVRVPEIKRRQKRKRGQGDGDDDDDGDSNNPQEVVYPKRYKADPVPDDVKVKKLTGPNQLFFMNLIRSCGSFTLREIEAARRPVAQEHLNRVVARIDAVTRRLGTPKNNANRPDLRALQSLNKQKEKDLAAATVEVKVAKADLAQARAYLKQDKKMLKEAQAATEAMRNARAAVDQRLHPLLRLPVSDAYLRRGGRGAGGGPVDPDAATLTALGVSSAPHPLLAARATPLDRTGGFAQYNPAKDDALNEILESLSANLAAVDTRLRAASEPATQMAMVANEVSAFVSNAEPAESAA